VLPNKSDFSSSSYRLYKGLSKGEKKGSGEVRREKRTTWLLQIRKWSGKKFFKVRKKSENVFFLESEKYFQEKSGKIEII